MFYPQYLKKMVFKSKKSYCSKTKNVTTGLFLKGTEEEKHSYHIEYNRLTRENESRISYISVSPASSSSSSCAEGSAPTSPPPPCSPPSTPPAPPAAPTPPSQSGLRSDRSRRRGRPTILERPLTAEEHSERKRRRYEDDKRSKSTSLARSVVAHNRWNKHLYVEEARDDDDEEEAEEEREAEVEGEAPAAQVDEIEVGDLVQNNEVVDEDEKEEQCHGSSERSKLRAREILNSHLSNHDQFFRVDVLRRLCLKLTVSGNVVAGVEVDSRAPTASNLTRRQITYAVPTDTCHYKCVTINMPFYPINMTFHVQNVFS